MEGDRYKSFVKDICRISTRLDHPDNHIRSTLSRTGLLHSISPTPASLRQSLRCANALWGGGAATVWWEWEENDLRLCAAWLEAYDRVHQEVLDMCILDHHLWIKRDESPADLFSPHCARLSVSEWLCSISQSGKTRSYPLLALHTKPKTRHEAALSLGDETTRTWSYESMVHAMENDIFKEDDTQELEPIADSGLVHATCPTRAQVRQHLERSSKVFGGNIGCWLEEDPTKPFPGALFGCSAWFDDESGSLVIKKSRVRYAHHRLQRIGRHQGRPNLYKTIVWATKWIDKTKVYPLLPHMASTSLVPEGGAHVVDLLRALGVSRVHDLSFFLDQCDAHVGTPIEPRPTVADEVLHPTGAVYNSIMSERPHEALALQVSLRAASERFDAEAAWYILRDGTSYYLMVLQALYNISSSKGAVLDEIQCTKRLLRLSRDGIKFRDVETGTWSPPILFFPETLPLRAMCRWVEDLLELPTGVAYPYAREEIFEGWRTTNEMRDLPRPFFVRAVRHKVHDKTLDVGLPPYLAHYGDQTFLDSPLRDMVVVHATIILPQDHEPLNVVWGAAPKTRSVSHQNSTLVVTGELNGFWDQERNYGIKMYEHRLSRILEIQLVLPKPSLCFGVWLSPSPDNAFVSIVWGNGTYPDKDSLSRADYMWSKASHKGKHRNMMFVMWGSSNGDGYNVSF